MNRINEKIKKLLALAQSDNPFEAQRAKTQANALIKRQSMDDMFLDICSFRTKRVIDGAYFMQSDSNLLNFISAVTGTTLTIIALEQNGYQPIFTGHKQDVDCADSLWECIKSQLDALCLQLKPHYNIEQIELYCMGFSNSVNTKLFKTFGYKEADAQTKACAKNQFGFCLSPKHKDTLPGNNKTPLEKSLVWTGFREGENVRINKEICAVC